jgi:hypothetical protein
MMVYTCMRFARRHPCSSAACDMGAPCMAMPLQPNENCKLHADVKSHTDGSEATNLQIFSSTLDEALIYRTVLLTLVLRTVEVSVFIAAVQLGCLCCVVVLVAVATVLWMCLLTVPQCVLHLAAAFALGFCRLCAFSPTLPPVYCAYSHVHIVIGIVMATYKTGNQEVF